MEALKLVEMPKYAYLVEVLKWMYLGRLPETYFDIDADCETHEPESTGCLDSDFYEEIDFENYGVEVDYNRYVEASYKNKIELRNSFDEIYSHIDLEGKKRAISLYKKYLKNVSYREKMELIFYTEKRRSVINLLHSLANGKLQAFGLSKQYCTDSLSENWTLDTEECYYFSPISANSWLAGDSNLEENYLSASGIEYSEIRVLVQDTLDMFPQTTLGSEVVGVRKVGSSYIIDEQGNPKKNPSKRGRPPKHGVSAREMVAREFERRRLRGELPDKREAIVEDAIEWSKMVVGVEVKRATVQNWLKNCFDGMPKKGASN